MGPRFSIAHVTPHPWELRSELNTYVERVTDELARRGHRVMVVAPSESAAVVRASRKALRDAREHPQALLGSDGRPSLFAAGEVIAVPTTPGRRQTGLPVDVARTVEDLLSTVSLDFVHVHEPFAPSTASAALRHSRSLNIGSFHAPAAGLVSTQVARRFVELFFGRLDARTASYGATGALMAKHFPADYRVILPGAELDPAVNRSEEPPSENRVHVAFFAEEERGALRLFLRALRHLDGNPGWRATVLSPRGDTTQVQLRASLRDRVRFATPDELGRDDLLADADILVCASDGQAPAPDLLLRGIAAGTVPLAARLPVYEEVLAEGERGLFFESGDAENLAGQLERLLGAPDLRGRLREAADPLRAELSWTRVVDELEDVYDGVAARRHDTTGNPELRAKLSTRRVIDVDLHMHTDHSNDCATPVEVLLATAIEQGLGAIAITDHNEISGAIEAQAKADGIKIILAEEVKTASQGEVIGLFLTEKIPRGLTLAETVAEIKRQGGLVYVPHPFDRMHSVPDYEHLLTILDDVDAIEVYNPRVAIGSFNEEAARFAAKYRIVAGAGSDSHVAAGLGSVRIRMRDFDGPQEFLESLRDADIVTKPTSLLYVQALKFLETKATPPGARRARRERRVRRATRKS
ncbi:MAG TPA: PHP domain-containing protein [Solirubrobacteraceae bacterium]|nr:PHP domain-containing protein [Solirubrobacteraceae bacterium]